MKKTSINQHRNRHWWNSYDWRFLVKKDKKNFKNEIKKAVRVNHKKMKKLAWMSKESSTSDQAGSYMFKVNNINTRARSEISSKLTIKVNIFMVAAPLILMGN